MSDPNDPNQHNPLRMRVQRKWPNATLGKMLYVEQETNWLNLMRESGGAWDNTRAYLKNEVTWYQGIEFIAWNDIAAGVAPTVIQNIGNPSDWVAMSGTQGRGAMRLNTPTATPGSIPTGDNWVTIPFDTQDYVPFGIEFDLANDTFDLDYLGLWDFSLLLSFSHDESNQGRDFTIRLFNVTDAIGADGIKIFVARNQPGTTISLPFDAPVTGSSFGDTFRFEVGDASATIGTVVWESTNVIARQSGILTQ